MCEAKSIVKQGAFDNGEAFELAQREAKALSQSDLMPTQFQNNIPNCLIALEMANRIGASVLAVAQSMYVVHGRPGWSSSFLIATVNSCGRFTPLRFEWRGEEKKPDWACRAVAIDKETDTICEGTWISWEMVKTEGWLSKKGSKWASMPEQMFCYRAAAFWQRIYAPELSLGMRTAEEIIDITPAQVVPANLQELTEKLKEKDEPKEEAKHPAVDETPEDFKLESEDERR